MKTVALVDPDTYTLISDQVLTLGDVQRLFARLAAERHVALLRVAAGLLGVIIDLLGVAQLDGPPGGLPNGDAPIEMPRLIDNLDGE